MPVARDPPDLGADFPDAFRSLRPGRALGELRRVSSRGVVQRSPLHRPLAGESASRRHLASPRGRCVASPLRPVLLRDGNAGSHPRAALVVSHHLDGLFLSDPAAIFRPLPIVGFTTFLPVAKQDSPRCGCCPSKLSLRRQRRRVRTNPVHRGPASPCRPSPVVAFTACLAPSPFLPASPRARASRPCSIVGSVARGDVSVPPCPVLPWACPALPPLRGKTRSGTNMPASRQRPLRRTGSSV
jgi:hypothetical protein